MNTITMPQAGQSMEEGTIVRWLKQEGDNVAQGELLLEIETDKATVEVEATQGGTLRKILAEAGTTLPVHAPIALVGAADEDLTAALAAVKTGAGVAAAAVAPAPATGGEARYEGVTAQAEAAVGGAMPADAVAILMPQAGQSMEEGTIVKWRVAPGDTIKVGDIIFEVETDKAVVEVEATDAGRLAKIVVPEGGVMAVKQPVAWLSNDDAALEAWLKASGGAAPAPAATPSPSAPVPQPSTTPVGGSKDTNGIAKPAAAESAAPAGGSPSRIPASPAARKMAAERGIDLSRIGAGSGPNGRILSIDVAAAKAPAKGGAPIEADVAPLAVPRGPVGEATRKKMSGMRKAIAKNLLYSKQNVPHFYVRMTIDADPLFTFYRAEKPRSGVSLNDLVVSACARVIYEFPAFRSRIDGDELVELPTSNIGIAVGMDEGLVVPVVIGAERRSLAELAAETRRVAEAARKGKIEGMGQGVFTISNLGMFGVEEFAAIINPPEAAILAVSAVREQVIVKHGMMRPGRVMTMTLSCDHRVIDGMLAAKFLARLKEVLEHPELLG